MPRFGLQLQQQLAQEAPLGPLGVAPRSAALYHTDLPGRGGAQDGFQPLRRARLCGEAGPYYRAKTD
eukprot:11196462-Lingulodinium_polyedra.AAC.1